MDNFGSIHPYAAFALMLGGIAAYIYLMLKILEFLGELLHLLFKD